MLLINSVQVINKLCMSSRNMSLLPRATLHSDSEHLFHAFFHQAPFSENVKFVLFNESLNVRCSEMQVILTCLTGGMHGPWQVAPMTASDTTHPFPVVWEKSLKFRIHFSRPCVFFCGHCTLLQGTNCWPDANSSFAMWLVNILLIFLKRQQQSFLKQTIA